MEKVYSKTGIVSDIKIRFGQEPSVKGKWKEIVNIDNKHEREKEIDDLLDLMENNVNNNGFFGSNDKVDCGGFGRGFLLNDKNLYYMFFNNLKMLNEQNVDGKVSEGSVINQAIKATIKEYAGGNETNRHLRLEKTELEITDGRVIVPSIAEQKGQNCFYCTERAAISHNFWLLTGVTSYFCFTNCDDFGIEDDEYKNDTHNFTIVEYDNKFRLYDIAMDNFCLLNNDCIDSLLSGKGLEVKDVKNPGIYATNDILESNETKNSGVYKINQSEIDAVKNDPANDGLFEKDLGIEITKEDKSNSAKKQNNEKI